MKNNLSTKNSGFTLTRRASQGFTLTRKTSQGFTLIELLVVIAIVGGLAGMFLFNFVSGQEKARDAQRVSDVKQLQTSLEVYAASNGNLFVNSSGSNQSGLCSAISLSSCPTQPNGAPPYQYQSTLTDYVIWAELEALSIDGDPQFFVACSTGQAGTTTAEPSSTTCTL